MNSPFDTTLLKLLDIDESSPLASAISGRTNLFELTEASYIAAIFPDDPGILSHSQRAALATRICLINNESLLADHYKDLVSEPEDSVLYAQNSTSEDNVMTTIVDHVDINSRNPKHHPEDQIQKLKVIGLTDTQIVSIFAVIAFVSYQLRVLKGLRAMKEAL